MSIILSSKVIIAFESSIWQIICCLRIQLDDAAAMRLFCQSLSLFYLSQLHYSMWRKWCQMHSNAQQYSLGLIIFGIAATCACMIVCWFLRIWLRRGLYLCQYYRFSWALHHQNNDDMRVKFGFPFASVTSCKIRCQSNVIDMEIVEKHWIVMFKIQSFWKRSNCSVCGTKQFDFGWIW